MVSFVSKVTHIPSSLSVFAIHFFHPIPSKGAAFSPPFIFSQPFSSTDRNTTEGGRERKEGGGSIIHIIICIFLSRHGKGRSICPQKVSGWWRRRKTNCYGSPLANYIFYFIFNKWIGGQGLKNIPFDTIFHPLLTHISIHISIHPRMKTFDTVHNRLAPALQSIYLYII